MQRGERRRARRHQVGVLQRVFVYQVDRGGEPIAVVNPLIVPRSDEPRDRREGCLSLGADPRAGRAPREVSGRGGTPDGAERPARAVRGPHRARGPARARPPRRRADHRPDDSRGAARGARLLRPRPSSGRVAASWSRLAFAATAPLGADVLERLAGRHDVDALVTRPDAPPDAAQAGAAAREGRPASARHPGNAAGAPRARARARCRHASSAPTACSSRRPPRPAALAERPPVPPAALARASTRGAGDHGRRPGDGCHDPPHDAELDAGPRCAARSRSPRTTTQAPFTSGPRRRGRAARRGARGAAPLRPQPDEA